MRSGHFEGVVWRAYLRFYDIFSPKKHLTIRAVHPIIYIIIVVLSADSKEKRHQQIFRLDKMAVMLLLIRWGLEMAEPVPAARKAILVVYSLLLQAISTSI